MSVSFSQACAAARKKSPRGATMTRSGAGPRPHKGREVSSTQPKRRRIKLNPQNAEERQVTDAYWAAMGQRPKRGPEFWRAKNQRRAEARAAGVAVSGLSRGLE